MSFSVGIVGLPNVGKSTLFKALTKKQVNISNYPFCTVDPNVGVVPVPDERLDQLKKILNPVKIIPTTIEFFDIAGLVKNAHQGEGLGNQFLAQIRETDAICQVVREFQDKNIAHVSGKVNPKEDIQTINLELIFADLQTIENRLKDLATKIKAQDKVALKQSEIINKLKQALEKEQLASTVSLHEEEQELVKDLHLLTTKPVLYVLNVDEKDRDKKTDDPLEISLSAKLEAELADLSEKEIEELGYITTGLDQLIKKSYEILNLITFFTIQNEILQVWTVEKDTIAPRAAAKVHTDFEEKFIKAEVINWQELVKVGSEHQAREKGLLRTEGKEYIVQDGDVIHFRI